MTTRKSTSSELESKLDSLVEAVAVMQATMNTQILVLSARMQEFREAWRDAQWEEEVAIATVNTIALAAPPSYGPHLHSSLKTGTKLTLQKEQFKFVNPWEANPWEQNPQGSKFTRFSPYQV